MQCTCETCTAVRALDNAGRVPPYKPEIEVGDAIKVEFEGLKADNVFVHGKDVLKAPIVRQFDTGATRDVDTNKLDFDGFISPLVLEAYGTYMNYNRLLANGTRRDSDNWQKGIPLTAYIKSGWRHFIDWWRISRGYSAHENLVWAIGGLMFNAMGYLHEALKKDPNLLKECLKQMEERRAASRQPTT